MSDARFLRPRSAGTRFLRRLVASYGGEVPARASYGGEVPARASYGGEVPARASYGGEVPARSSYGCEVPARSSYGCEVPARASYGCEVPARASYGGEVPARAAKCQHALALRPMVAADIPAVVALDRLSFATPWSASAFRHEVCTSNYSYMLILERSSPQPSERSWQEWLPWRPRRHSPAQPGGYGGLWVIEDEGHISTLAVQPSERGQRWGELLLTAAHPTRVDRRRRLYRAGSSCFQPHRSGALPQKWLRHHRAPPALLRRFRRRFHHAPGSGCARHRPLSTKARRPLAPIR